MPVEAHLHQSPAILRHDDGCTSDWRSAVLSALWSTFSTASTDLVAAYLPAARGVVPTPTRIAIVKTPLANCRVNYTTSLNIAASWNYWSYTSETAEATRQAYRKERLQYKTKKMIGDNEFCVDLNA
jgi:hypothetical protein